MQAKNSNHTQEKGNPYKEYLANNISTRRMTLPGTIDNNRR